MGKDFEKCKAWYESTRDALMQEYAIMDVHTFNTSRCMPIPNIRCILWKEAYALFDVSTIDLGAICCKNHATIIQGMKRVFWLLQSKDKVVCGIYDKIKQIDKLNTMDKKECIYVSLPFSLDENANKERSQRAIAKFKAQGHNKVLTSFELLDSCIFENKMEEQKWIGKRIENILIADAAVFASGWYEDKMCLLEKDACQRFGIETFTDGKI